MAPTPKKRTTMRSRAAANSRPNTAVKNSIPPRDAYQIFPMAPRPAALDLPQNGQLKEWMEQGRKRQEQDRVRDGGITKRYQQKSRKKLRRPGKKLLAAQDMDELREALPDLPNTTHRGRADEWEGFSDEDAAAQTGGKRRRRKAKTDDGKIEMRSLKHRPGAMKRKRKMEDVEMDRFSRNLAQLSANTKAEGLKAEEGGRGEAKEGGDGSGATRKEKWAALRSFIGSTMERKEGLEDS